MDNNHITNAGDVLVENVTIINVNTGIIFDVTPQTILINIHESINDVFMYGDITLKDAQNITNLFPLSGNELINIHFRTPGLDNNLAYKKTFVIASNSEKAKYSREGVYVLSLISPEAVIDSFTKISKKIFGNATEAVQSILEYFRHDVTNTTNHTPVVLEKTINDVCFVSNWWKPSKCIEYICKRALDEHGYPAMLFFENRHGFNFVSLQSIIESSKKLGPYMTFRVDDSKSITAAENENSTSKIVVSSQYSDIVNIRYLNCFDYFKRADSGFYGGEVVGFDINAGQYVHYKDLLPEASRPGLNEFKQNTWTNFGETSSLMNYSIIGSFVHDTSVNELTHRRQFLPRKAILAQFGQGGKLVIDVKGRTDYNIGQVVNVVVPKDQQILKDEDPVDRLVSGNYLIYEIQHTIFVGSKCTHRTTMNLVKDSYMVDINHSTLNENSKQ